MRREFQFNEDALEELQQEVEKILPERAHTVSDGSETGVEVKFENLPEEQSSDGVVSGAQ